MNYTPAALDPGFGYTEALTPYGNVTIQSVAGEPITLLDGNGITKGPGGIISTLNNNRTLFVGKIAVRQSPIVYFSLKENKPDDTITRFVGLTALAMTLPEEIPLPIRLVTALPVNHYHTMRVAAEQSFLGQHEVIINGKLKKFKIERCCTTVQGLEALFDQILDDNGNIVAPWATHATAIVDIGFYTTNLLVINRLEPISRICKSIPVGISAAWKLLSDFIYKELNIEFSLYELDEIAKTNIVEAHGKEYDVSEAVNHALSAIANKINGEIETLWPQRPFSKIIGAGGGMLRMKEKILPGELLPVSDPQGANARGGLKLAKRESAWQKKTS